MVHQSLSELDVHIVVYPLMNLLDEQPRSATAYVLDDSRLLSLEKSRLRGLIIHYPELSLGMLKGLSLRLRNANFLAKGHT